MSELVNKSEVLDIWNNYWITDMTTLDAENQLRELATVELKSAPQLNENQQIVLEWLKNKYTITDIEPIELFWRLHVNTKNKFRTLLAYRTYKYLTRKAQLEVLQVFSQWAQEQEEE